MRNSKFWGNSVYDIFLQSNSGPVSNLLIENNWFASPVGQGGTGSGSSTVAFSGGCADFANTTVRHNSFNGYFSFDDNGNNPAYTNFKVVGNIGQPTYGSCSLRGVIFATTSGGAWPAAPATSISVAPSRSSTRSTAPAWTTT